MIKGHLKIIEKDGRVHEYDLFTNSADFDFLVELVYRPDFRVQSMSQRMKYEVEREVKR